jgi:hypothetical protein
MTTPITKEQQASIEAGWRSRAATQGYNPRHMEYKRAELEYFMGAMQALDSLGLSGPPIWIFNVVGGRPIVEEIK